MYTVVCTSHVKQDFCNVIYRISNGTFNYSYKIFQVNMIFIEILSRGEYILKMWKISTMLEFSLQNVVAVNMKTKDKNIFFLTSRHQSMIERLFVYVFTKSEVVKIC